MAVLDCDSISQHGPLNYVKSNIQKLASYIVIYKYNYSYFITACLVHLHAILYNKVLLTSMISKVVTESCDPKGLQSMHA